MQPGDEAEFAKVIAEGPLANLLGRASLAEDVADTIVYLCLPGSRQITGQTIHVDGGTNAASGWHHNPETGDYQLGPR